MLKTNQQKIKKYRKPFIFLGLSLLLIIVGINTTIPAIKTISFFLIFEMLIVGILYVIVKYSSRFETLKKYCFKSISNFILGLHLSAGMIVLGVYFTV